MTIEPIETYSKPISSEKTKLGIFYSLRPRRNPNKAGRELLVVYDERSLLVPNFKVHYAYYVRFLEPGNTAGNHYHRKKQEIFVPITGEFEICLEDIVTKEKEILRMIAGDNRVFYIPLGIAHKVTAKGRNDVFLVLADHPSSDEDEISYGV